MKIFMIKLIQLRIIAKDLYYEDLLSKEYYNALISRLDEEDPDDYYKFDDAVDDFIEAGRNLMNANTEFGHVFYSICNEF